MGKAGTHPLAGSKTDQWVPAFAGMTILLAVSRFRSARNQLPVPGLVPGIHVFLDAPQTVQDAVTGTRPGTGPMRQQPHRHPRVLRVSFASFAIIIPTATFFAHERFGSSR